MPIKIPTVQTGLEASIQAAAKKAGRNLKINMGGNAKSIEGLSQPLGRITGKADQFTKSMEAANARVLAFGASVGILSAVTRGFKELVLTTIEVEKSLVSINSILGGSKKELEAFSKTIFDVARSTEQSFAAVSTAALELTRQGLTAVEVQKRLSDSLILSRLSGLGATEAVSGLTAAINSFNKAGLSSGQVLNKLSAAAVSAAVSERDLIEGIKRAGSVANLAGVSFDELVGVITAVQVKTARGGAVIGNSFKTIFTRIQSLDKLETMQNLGVQVTDTSGKVLGATKLIQNLSKVLAELPEAKRLQIAEGLVGKFQIAPFLAILDDYNSKTSKAIAITEVSRQATSEAYDRNIALNQTLSTAINKATISLKELGDTLGKIGVTDNLKNLLGFFDTLVQSVKGKLDGEGAGGDFAKGIVKGIGAVISGPGLAIFGAIILKLGFDLAKFGIGSLKTFFGLNQAAKEQATLQGRIASTLLSNKSIQEQILSIENSSLSAEKKKVEQTKFFTTAIREQLGLMTQMQGIAMKVAPGVRAATKGRAAGGFIPNYNAIAGYGSESSDISKGVGGAPTSAKPVTIPNFNFGGGQKGTMVANSSEYVVPNYAGSGGSAIFNQDMVSSMGMPAGARKISASGGYIPNFALDELNDDKRLVMFSGDEDEARGRGPDIQKKFFVGRKLKQTTAYATKPSAKANKATNIKAVNVPEYKLGPVGTNKNQSPLSIKIIRDKLSDSSTTTALDFAKSLAPESGVPNVSKAKIKELFNPGAFEGMSGTIFEVALSGVLSDKEFDDYSTRTSNSRIDLPYSPKLFNLFGTKGNGTMGAEVKANSKLASAAAVKFYDILQRGKSVAEYKDKVQVYDKNGEPIKGKFEKTELGARLTKSEFKTLYPQGHSSGLGFQALNTALGGSKTRPVMTVGNLANFGKRGAEGYIPNFANPLQDAIGREQAAGLPVNQIRINQSPKLRNAGNPMGLAVTNTRDEPTGAIPNFASTIRVGDQNRPMTKGAEKSLKDFTKRTKEATKGQRDMLGGIFATQIAFSAISGATSDMDEGFGRVINRTADLASSFTTAAFAASAINDFGKSIGGKRGSVISKLGIFGAVIGGGIAAFKSLNTMWQDHTGETAKSANALAHLADITDKVSVNFKEISALEKSELTNQAKTVLNEPLTVYTDKEGKMGSLVRFLTKEIFDRDYTNPEVEKGFTQATFDALRLGQSLETVRKRIRKFGFEIDGTELALFADGNKALSDEVTIFKEHLKDVSSEDLDALRRPLGDVPAGNIIPSPKVLNDALRRTDPFGNLSDETRSSAVDLEEARRAKKTVADKKENARISNQLAKQRIAHAVALAKLERKILNDLELQFFAADRAGTLSIDQRKNAIIEIANAKQQFDLRNKTLDTIEKISAESRVLTQEEGINKKLVEQILGLSEGARDTEEDRKNILVGIQQLLKDDTTNIKAKIGPLLKALDVSEKELENAKERAIAEARINAEVNKRNDNRNNETTNNKALLEKGNSGRLRALNESKTSIEQGISLRSGIPRSVREEKVNSIEIARETKTLASLNAEISSENVDQGIRNKIIEFGKRANTKFPGDFSDKENEDLGKKIDLLTGQGLILELQKLMKKEGIGEVVNTTKRTADGEIFTEAASTPLATDIKAFISTSQDRLRDNAIDNQKLKDNANNAFDISTRPIEKSFKQLIDNMQEQLMNTENLAQARIDNSISTDPVQRLKFRFNQRNEQDRIKALDSKNPNLELFRKLTEENEFAGKLIDASAQFAQNIGDAMIQAIAQGKSLSDLLLGAASGFFNTLSQAFMQKAVGNIMSGFNAGGKVRGGSGNRDDVPALLTGGEFVMKKSSVNKYGSSFMASLNAGEIPAMARGGLFTPGTYGQEEIKGKSNLLDFATQSHTTGAFDKFRSGSGFASVNLEPQSAALTMFGRRNSPAFQREQESKEEAFGLFTQQANKDKELKEQKKQATKGLLGSIASSLFAFGFSSLTDKFSKNATGGAIPNAAGVDTVPSMLSGGEFVMNAAATQKIGRGNLNALNSGAGGGSGDVVSKLDELISVSDNTGETVINITVNSDGSSDSQGNGDDQQKSLATKIKDVVKQVIDDEKRLGGSLRQSRA